MANEPLSWRAYLAGRIAAEVIDPAGYIPLLQDGEVLKVPVDLLVSAFGPGWRADHIRVVSESGAVLPGDRIIVIKCVGADVVLSLQSAASVLARELIVIRGDATEHVATVTAEENETLPTAEGRQRSLDLTMQDEVIRLIPDGVDHYYLLKG